MGYSQDEAGFRRKQMPARSRIQSKCQPIKDLGTKEQHKRENPGWTGRVLKRVPFMPSIPWAFGPPILVKVRLPVIPSEARNLLVLCLYNESRFLVATLLGMTEWLDDSRRSVAKHLFYAMEKTRKQIPLPRLRDRDDMIGRVFGGLLVLVGGWGQGPAS